MYVAIRVRGSINLSPDAKKTLETLGLNKVNTAVILPKKKEIEKMLLSVQNYLTYGEASEETIKMLIEKKGLPLNPEEKVDSEKAINALKEGKSIKSVGVKNCFRLNPPRKGWERKGIKKPFNLGGALGYRGNAINELVKRML